MSESASASSSPQVEGPGTAQGSSATELLAEFRYLLRRFLQFSEEAAVEAGLTPQHHQLLLQLAGAPGGTLTTVSYLADRLVLRHHSAVELAKRCEEAGLVRREQNPHNRRQVVLTLSERGSAVLERLSAAHAQEVNELGPQLVEVLGRLMTTDRGAAPGAESVRSQVSVGERE